MNIGEVHDSVFGEARVHRDVQESGVIVIQNRREPNYLARNHSGLDELQTASPFGY